jgi:hypothetical protein
MQRNDLTARLPVLLVLPCCGEIMEIVRFSTRIGGTDLQCHLQFEGLGGNRCSYIVQLWT